MTAPIPKTMRAWRAHEYGGPGVMHLDSVPVPRPGPGEVLVRVLAASVNPIDWKTREGYLKAALTSPLPRTLGRDAAGEVVALGEGVSGLVTGNMVAGAGVPSKDGTHAEYALMPAAACSVMPVGVTPEQGAALGIAGLSAWIPLVESAGLAQGQKVLIHAGAGGVGSMAIQIAHHIGAEVWTTCGARNADWCRALGAQHVIDYGREKFEDVARGMDVAFDTIGGEVHARSAATLKPGGALVWINAIPPAAHGRTDIRAVPPNIQSSTARMWSLLNLVASGALRVPVEHRFELSRAAEAYAMSQGGHTRGKIVLTM